MQIYIYVYGSVSLIHGSTNSTVSPRVTHIHQAWAIHKSARLHIRQQTCLLHDTADTSAV